MKHNFLVVLLAIAATICMAFGFAACDEQPDNTGKNPSGGEQGTPAPHVHSYGEWKVTKVATCKEMGVKERSCACGEKETEALPFAGHDFENMACKVCGTKASLGLEYTLINDDKEYEVSGIGDCTDTDLIITNNYQGKPVTEIGERAFENCSGLTSVTIPDSVTEIGDEAFGICWRLTSITIPDSVTEIGEDAFMACSGLTSVTIPESVMDIGDAAFYGCSGLTEIQVDEKNQTYHTQGNCLIETKSKTLLLGCKTSKIPDDGSVISIGYGAFAGCSGLTSIDIPDGVTEIGDEAFVACSGLTSIIIPDSVTEIGDEAFVACSGLTSIIIPDSVTEIGHEAFFECSELTSVTIGSGVTSIGPGAFMGCNGLTSVTIPDSVTEIGDRAFGWCDNLKEVHFENPNGWEVSKNKDMSDAEAVFGLEDPAQAAEYLTHTYIWYYWKREG